MSSNSSLRSSRPRQLNLDAIRIEEEHDAELRRTTDGTERLETELCHGLDRCRQIFHVEIDAVDAEMIDRRRIRRRVVVRAFPLPQLQRCTIGPFAEAQVRRDSMRRKVV